MCEVTIDILIAYTHSHARHVMVPMRTSMHCGGEWAFNRTPLALRHRTSQLCIRLLTRCAALSTSQLKGIYRGSPNSAQNVAWDVLSKNFVLDFVTQNVVEFVQWQTAGHWEEAWWFWENVLTMMARLQLNNLA